jgi:hypothetical protein
MLFIFSINKMARAQVEIGIKKNVLKKGFSRVLENHKNLVAVYFPDRYAQLNQSN